MLMPRILLTGATGFVGSVLATTLLARGVRVTAISRRDTAGYRTVASILEAARGCGIRFTAEMADRLQTFDMGDRALSESLDDMAIDDIDAVWHCAADMSHSGLRLTQAFNTNVCETAALYRWASTKLPRCKRFYHMSTAYTAGMHGGATEERLHAGQRLVNAYQVTKWAAEQALHTLHAACNLPVTLFRPTIVVGHSQSGWTRRNGFGFYMFVEAVEAARAAGQTRVAYDMPDGPCIDLITVDSLVRDAVDLTLQAHDRGNFEVFHCAGGRSMSSREMLSMIGDLLAVRIVSAPAESSHDRSFARAVGPNRPFAEMDWDFRRTRLDAVLGRDSGAEPVCRTQLRKLILWYVDAIRSAGDGAIVPAEAAG